MMGPSMRRTPTIRRAHKTRTRDAVCGAWEPDAESTETISRGAGGGGVGL